MMRRSASALRWAARAVSTVAGAFWLLVGLGHAVAGDPEPFTWESFGVLTLIVLATASVALAWWRERIGGPALFAVGMAFSAFALATAGRNHAFAMLTSGGPFIVSGAIFLVLRIRLTQT